MKRNLFIAGVLALASFVLTLNGCKEPEEPTLTPSFPEKIVANVEAGQEFKFTIEPNMQWSLKIPSEVATYFKFIVGSSERYTLTGAAGTHEITVGVAPNEEFDNVRECAIEMTMGGESRVVAQLTRGSKERQIAIYVAEFVEEDGFVKDEEGNWAYSTTAIESLDWRWFNERWMQRIVVEANFKWNLGANTPEWFDASTTSGKEGRTEIFIRVNDEQRPFETENVVIEFCDTSDRNGDGVYDQNDILVVKSLPTTVEGCLDVCSVDLSGTIEFNAEGQYYQPSSLAYIDLAYGRIYATKGAELFAVNKEQDGSYTTENCDWINVTIDDLPEDAATRGIWERVFQLDVEINETSTPRYGALVALSAADAAGTYNIADHIICEITQKGANINDGNEAIVAFDEELMKGYGAMFEKLEKNTWPWTNNWANIPYAYKLTLRDNNSGDDLIFNKPFASYKIFGYAGYTGATYDPETCWLTISESDPEEEIANGYIIRSRLDEEEFPNTLPGGKKDEATFVFYNESGEAYALIYVVLDPDFTPFGGVKGDVKFTNPTEAIESGARLDEIVKGDEEYDEENAFMGILQYRLTLNPNCKTISLNLPEYTLAYPYQEWIQTYMEGKNTIIEVSSESSANGRITFYGSNNYNVILQLLVVYKAE